jgi:hypothetical protein
MNLIKVPTQYYPYTIQELRKDFPNVSFPSTLEGLDLSEYDAAEVITEEPPTDFDSATSVLEALPPTLVDGVWTVSWSVRDLTAEEIKERSPVDWDGFSLAFLTDPTFNSYHVLGLQSETASVATSALPTALAQVETKGTASFGMVFPIFCTALGVTPEDREVWAGMAEDCNLPEAFVAILRGTN